MFLQKERQLFAERKKIKGISRTKKWNGPDKVFFNQVFVFLAKNVRKTSFPSSHETLYSVPRILNF